MSIELLLEIIGSIALRIVLVTALILFMYQCFCIGAYIIDLIKNK
ncbi:MAG: hypothetical protein ACRCZ1_04345 [Cetobacterium sp.]